MTRILIFLTALMVLDGCSRLPRLPVPNLAQRTVPAGLPFAAELAPASDPQNFSVVVDARGAGLEAIRESVRYPATRYCVGEFGSSTIRWESTADPRDWTYTARPDGRLVFGGRCLAR